MEQCEGNKLILDKNSKTNALPPSWDYSAPLPLPKTTFTFRDTGFKDSTYQGEANLGSF